MQSFIKQDRPKIMDMDTFDTLCYRMADFDDRLKQVNWAGWGEPLVNKNLPGMIDELRAYDITENIAVVTNGLLLEPSLSYDLIESGLNHLRISLQGMTSEKYKEVCGKGIDYEAFIENIRWFYNHKKDCQISIKIADVSLGEGERELFFDTFEPMADRVYVESIRPMFSQNKQDGMIISKYGEEHPPVSTCPLPFYMFSITAAGDILPCCAYSDPVGLGNIKDKSLKLLWEGQEMREFQIMLLSGQRNNQNRYPVCCHCLMPDAILTPGDNIDVKAKEITRRLL